MIPSRLHNEAFRFVKILPKSKAPFEQAWSTTANYQFNDAGLQAHITSGGNYGVCGGFGNLVILDCDRDDVADAVRRDLPETFTVKTGSGKWHFYYICPDLDKPIRLSDQTQGDLGDVQWKGKQVVGPESTHPNGNMYVVEKDMPLATIAKEELMVALKDYLKIRIDAPLQANGNKIDITKVLDINALTCRGSYYQGAHPVHGSPHTGMNFTVDIDKGVWHCFNHETGGGPLQWIAVKEGIIECIDCLPGALRGAKFAEVARLARTKYGLDIGNEYGERKPYFSYKMKNGKWGVERVLHDTLAKLFVERLIIKTMRDNDECFVYFPSEGLYKPVLSSTISEEADELLGNFYSSMVLNNILLCIRAKTYKDRDSLEMAHNMLHTQNGVLDVTTGILNDFDPKYFSTSCIPVKYDPEADCPAIKKFMSEVMDADDILPMQEMFGYCLYKKHPFHKAFMMLGDGANGKSTLISLLKAFLGPNNCASVPLQEMESNRFAVSLLHGKLANLFADLQNKALYETGRLKTLTGEDSVMGEHKFKDPFSFVNYAKQIYSCNKLPETHDNSDAFFRRWKIIIFKNKFEGDRADKKLIEKMTTPEELSGLLNWALAGLKRLLERGMFSNEASTDDVREFYKRLSNSMEAFTMDTLEYDAQGFIVKDVLYSEYVEYCQARKILTKSKIAFGKELPKVMAVTDGRDTSGSLRVWKGIKFKSEADRTESEHQAKLVSQRVGKTEQIAPLEIGKGVVYEWLSDKSDKSDKNP